MRRTAVTLGVVALLAVAGLGAATAAGAATPDTTMEGSTAEGFYVALNGTSDEGAWAAQSDAIVDPQLGTCYDLQSLATGPAAWTESVNRTDTVALLSSKSCAEIAEQLTEGEPDAGHAPHWTSPQSVSGDGSGSFTFRSVRFANVG
jgi:hypothetical protein